MKKFFTLFVLCSLFTCFYVDAYTQSDFHNANTLAIEGLINKQVLPRDYRLDDSISRVEAIKVVLKLKGIEVPQNYICKNMFRDTKYIAGQGWICQIIEIAASNGIISKYNSNARPRDSITRAEALAIVLRTTFSEGETDFSSPSPGPGDAQYVTTDADSKSPWFDVLYYAGITGVIKNPNFQNDSLVSREKEVPFYFYPDRPATRADFFSFTRNTEAQFKNVLCNRQKLVTLSEEYYKKGDCIYFKTSGAYEGSKMVYINNADNDSFSVIDGIYSRDKDTVFKINQGGYISIDIGENFSTESNANLNLIVIRDGQKYLADFSIKQLTKI